jgi:hypothetical protein
MCSPTESASDTDPQHQSTRATECRNQAAHECRRHLSDYEAAITRLVGAFLLEQNDEWQLQRRYMQLEGLQSLVDSQPGRLSAVVN